MTSPQPASDPGRPQHGWRGARPELAVAAAVVVAAALAGYALAGPEAVTIVVIGAAACALLIVRGLLPATPEPPAIEGGTDRISSSWSTYRYWRYLSDLRDGIEARASYEVRLRPALEHLLAARLAERHSVNLYTDPAAAQRLLCRGGRDNDLWVWIDPAQAGQTATDPRHQRGSQLPGIPRHTLERLINRLEQL
jgi:hypothetical protein